jgi:hypothetical protein
MPVAGASRCPGDEGRFKLAGGWGYTDLVLDPSRCTGQLIWETPWREAVLGNTQRTACERGRRTRAPWWQEEPAAPPKGCIAVTLHLRLRAPVLYSTLARDRSISRWVDLKDPCHGTEAQPFGQRGHDPHDQFRRHALAMQRRTVGPQKIPATGYTVQLPPWTATRMAIRANIASADPAIMPRGRLRAELVRSGHLPRTATRGGHQRWQGNGRLMAVCFGVLTGGTEGLVRQSGEGFPRL